MNHLILDPLNMEEYLIYISLISRDSAELLIIPEIMYAVLFSEAGAPAWCLLSDCRCRGGDGPFCYR